MTRPLNQQATPETRAAWVYTAHFGLTEAPFTTTPDLRFFFAHESCQIALTTLMVATRSGEGFTKVTGEVGTGKTLLCRKFLSALDENFVTAYIPNPYLEPMTLLLAVADELGVPYPANVSQHQLLKAFMTFLIETYAKYKCTVVVCLDEAHALPTETLEALRLLSNLETPRRKLLQLVLFGQPELDKRLDHPSTRQLKQRISFSCALQALDLQGVEYYVSHRLSMAGYRGARLFTPHAIRLLYKASNGIPRLINILAHKAMMAAFGEGVHTITNRHIRQALDDTESVRSVVRRRRLIKYITTLIGVALLSAGTAVWGGWV